jgi:hypothetical protein
MRAWLEEKGYKGATGARATKAKATTLYIAVVTLVLK